MAFHVLGGTTDRSFSKGERLCRQWRFEEGIECFNRSLQLDPSYAHIYLYKALALAELGRYEDALRELAQGARLEPANFVFPMYEGCIHLDEGRPAAAAFRAASSLAPTNALVAGYHTLASYVDGDVGALAQLARSLPGLPGSFKSRLLVAVGPTKHWWDHSPQPRGSKASGDWLVLADLANWYRRWQVARFERHARTLIERKRYESAFELLRAGEDQLGPEMRSLMQTARGHVEKAFKSELATIEAQAAAAGGQSRKRQKVEKQRRAVLLQLAHLYGAEDPKRFQLLERSIKSFRASHGSKGDQPLAAHILTEMAELSGRLGRLDSAMALCEESRAVGYVPEVDWVDAHARLLKGERRLARRLFERFARNRPLVFDERVSHTLARAVPTD
jgi:tetratricopeptide (TPR) repeat protein